MTVPATGSDALAPVRERVALRLGDAAARRLRSFPNAVLYIDAPFGRSFLAWLVDVTVVVGVGVGLGIAVWAASSSPDPVPGAALITIVLLLVLPFLYAWCFRNGRALGGLVTGTRLVRIRDGGRIGWGKAGWAMLVRVFFLPFLLLTLFDSGPMADFSPVRTSIDDRATRKLRALGIAR